MQTFICSSESPEAARTPRAALEAHGRRAIRFRHATEARPYRGGDGDGRTASLSCAELWIASLRRCPISKRRRRFRSAAMISFARPTGVPSPPQLPAGPVSRLLCWPTASRSLPYWLSWRRLKGSDTKTGRLTWSAATPPVAAPSNGQRRAMPGSVHFNAEDTETAARAEYRAAL